MILQYILLCVCLLFVVVYVAIVSAGHNNARYKMRLQEAKEKQKEHEKERLKHKYSKVTLGNKILDRITKIHIIIFDGVAGSGKSLLMSLFCWYIYQRWRRKNRKDKRLNKYLKPDYVHQVQELKDNKLLPVYSNLTMTDNKGYSSHGDYEMYMYQYKRIIEGGILAIDEIGEVLGKMYYWTARNDPNSKDVSELGRFIRHFIDGYIVATEQNGSNVWCELRGYGSAGVTALNTTVRIARRGKFLRMLCNAALFLLPGMCTLSWLRMWRQELHTRGRILLLIKMLLPAYFAKPRDYYVRKVNINKRIKSHYTRYETVFAFADKEYLLKFSNKQKLDYNTRARQNVYADKFDEAGNRKFVEV